MSRPVASRFAAPGVAGLLVLFGTAPAALAQADLSVSAALEPGDEFAEAGDRVQVEYVAQNFGNFDVDDPVVGFYLSEDEAFGDDDTFLESETLSDLDAGETDEESEEVPLPDNVADGEYFLLVVMDPFDNVAESDEGNNLDALPITIGDGGPGGGGTPDLVPIVSRSEVRVYGTAASGVTIFGDANVKNIGDATSGEFSVRYWLSDDKVLSGDDVELSRDGFDPIVAGGSRTEGFGADLPRSTGGGDYFVLVEADFRGEVEESDETNNVRALPFTVEGDPAVGAIDLRARLDYVNVSRSRRGRLLDYSYAADQRRAGRRPGVPHRPIPDPGLRRPVDGAVIDKRVSNGVRAGGEKSWSGSTSLPRNLSPWYARSASRPRYYAVAWSDPSDALEETDEGNNYDWRYVYVR